MLAAFGSLGLNRVRKLRTDQVIGIARISQNMKLAGFNDDEVSLLLRALYLEGTRHDMREVWWMFDRNRIGDIPRHDLQQVATHCCHR